MKRETFVVADIYVPIKRRLTLDPKRVDEIAQSMLADGQKTPIRIAARWQTLRARRRTAPAGGGQGAWRANDPRLLRGRAEALIRSKPDRVIGRKTRALRAYTFCICPFGLA